jgi:hypothetical protein
LIAAPSRGRFSGAGGAAFGASGAPVTEPPERDTRRGSVQWWQWEA